MPSLNLGVPPKKRIKIVATGGSTTDHNGWRIHTITSSTNFTITSGFDEVQIQLLGAGGGGGADNNGAGGGGAGGLVNASSFIGPGIYPIVLSSGGVGATAHSAPGTGASSSTGLGFTASGGGRGGAYGNAGGSGGCGGGGGFYQPGGSGSQGFSGAGGFLYSGGGGGGIGSIGIGGSQSGFPTYSGAGGNGLALPLNSWLPSTVGRGGGGGGGGGDYGGASYDGAGIGRGMLNSPTVGGTATANYGAGGGGGWSAAGNGSTGICYIRYRI